MSDGRTIAVMLVCSVLYVAALIASLLVDLPSSEDPSAFAAVVNGLRPYAHVLAFVPLGIACCGPHSTAPWVRIAALVLFAVMTEAMQGLTSDRTPDLWDCAQNLTGILIGAAIAAAWRQNKG